MAVAALVLGILATGLCWLWYVSSPLGIAAVVFGAIGLSRTGKPAGGRGLAIAGLVLGLVALVLTGGVVVVGLLSDVAEHVNTDTDWMRGKK
jgi:hypothetical protein